MLELKVAPPGSGYAAAADGAVVGVGRIASYSFRKALKALDIGCVSPPRTVASPPPRSCICRLTGLGGQHHSFTLPDAPSFSLSVSLSLSVRPPHSFGECVQDQWRLTPAMARHISAAYQPPRCPGTVTHQSSYQGRPAQLLSGLQSGCRYGASDELNPQASLRGNGDHPCLTPQFSGISAQPTEKRTDQHEQTRVPVHRPPDHKNHKNATVLAEVSGR